MKRFLIVSVLLGLSLVLLVFLGGANSRLPKLSELTLPAEEYEALKQGRVEDNSLMPERIRFNSCDLFYDADNSRWFWSLNEDEDTDVSVEVSGAKAAFMEFELTAASIRSAEEIPFLLYTDSAYRECSLAVTTLPLLRIESRKLVANDFDENTPTPQNIERLDGERDDPGEFRRWADQLMTLTLWDNRADTTQHIIQRDGLIRLRGNASSYLAKTGYRITLNTEANLLGLRTDNDWLLYTPYNDQDKIRNVFMTNLWTETCGTNNTFGVVNGIEYRWVELFLNDRYWGIYALGYPFDSLQLRLRDPETEFIVKVDRWTNPETVAEGKDFSASGYELRGTYTEEQTAAHFRQIREVNRHWVSADTEAILAETDLPSAIDTFLFIRFMPGTDHVRPDTGEIYNLFFEFKKTDDGRQLLMFTPWDMDMSVGNRYNRAFAEATEPWAVSSDDNSYVMKYNPAAVLERAGDEEITEMIRGRWQELRATTWSDEAIDAAIETHRAALWDSGAMIREQSTWPNAPYEGDELAHFKTYVHERLESMDGLYSQ